MNFEQKWKILMAVKKQLEKSATLAEDTKYKEKTNELLVKAQKIFNLKQKLD